LICPQCHAEYIPGFTRCDDCGVELVDELPTKKPAAAEPAHRGPSGDSVIVFSTRDPGLAAIAQSLLQSAGIRFLVRGQLLPYPTALPVELEVLADDADDARRILAEL